MLEIKACDDGNGWRHDIGGVVRAAQADLDRRQFAAGIGKCLERHHRHQLECGDLSQLRSIQLERLDG